MGHCLSLPTVQTKQRWCEFGKAANSRWRECLRNMFEKSVIVFWWWCYCNKIISFHCFFPLLGLCANGPGSDIWLHMDCHLIFGRRHIVFSVFPFSHLCDCGWMAFQRVVRLENRLHYSSSWPLEHWGWIRQ